jgi:hypothetical protein
VRLRIQVPERVTAGDPVVMVLAVENVSGRPVTLYLTGRPVAFDVVVDDADGATMWRRQGEQVATMVLQLRELAPGEALTFETTWNQRTDTGKRVPPGAYTVRGLLPTDGPTPLATPAARLVIGRA